MVSRLKRRQGRRRLALRENAAGIFIIVIIAVIGTILQIRYIKNKAAEQAAFVICNACKGTGLEDNTGNPHPSFPYGAMPQFQHLLKGLEMGYQLHEIACHYCRGLGLVQNLEGDTAGLARQYLDEVEMLLVRNKLAASLSGSPEFETKRQDYIDMRSQDKVGSELEKTECPECNGKGEAARYPDDPENEEKATCKVCYGLGYRYIKRLDDRPDLCPSCAGLGRIIDVESGQARTCRRCDGFGLMKTESPEE